MVVGDGFFGFISFCVGWVVEVLEKFCDIGLCIGFKLYGFVGIIYGGLWESYFG